MRWFGFDFSGDDEIGAQDLIAIERDRVSRQLGPYQSGCAPDNRDSAREDKRGRETGAKQGPQVAVSGETAGWPVTC